MADHRSAKRARALDAVGTGASGRPRPVRRGRIVRRSPHTRPQGCSSKGVARGSALSSSVGAICISGGCININIVYLAMRGNSGGTRRVTRKAGLRQGRRSNPHRERSQRTCARYATQPCSWISSFACLGSGRHARGARCFALTHRHSAWTLRSSGQAIAGSARTPPGKTRTPRDLEQPCTQGATLRRRFRRPTRRLPPDAGADTRRASLARPSCCATLAGTIGRRHRRARRSRRRRGASRS